jgi:hypothetical protein
MDFSDFSNQDNAKSILHRGEQAGGLFDHENWGFAATNVAVWNTIITIGLAVPVAAFLESFKHEPVQHPDGTWAWAYDVTVGGVGHSAELQAIAVDGDIHWTMLVSKDGAYTDFTWFTGVSNLPATEGTWTLNRSPEDLNPFIGIEWHRNPLKETGDITYTNIVPDGPENGGYISYGTTTGTPYDAFYDIYNKGLDNHTEIEWNRTTKEGRVKDPRHFGDDDWRCWDSDLIDVDCS